MTVPRSKGTAPRERSTAVLWIRVERATTQVVALAKSKYSPEGRVATMGGTPGRSHSSSDRDRPRLDLPCLRGISQGPSGKIWGKPQLKRKKLTLRLQDRQRGTIFRRRSRSRARTGEGKT